jgi:hypothetical protein
VWLLGPIAPQVKACAARTPKHPEPFITFRFTFQGKTGGVAEYEIIQGSAELRACLDPLIRQLAFESFERPTYKVQFPYRY